MYQVDFDDIVMYATIVGPAYYLEILESVGFGPVIDLVVLLNIKLLFCMIFLLIKNR